MFLSLRQKQITFLLVMLYGCLATLGQGLHLLVATDCGCLLHVSLRNQTETKESSAHACSHASCSSHRHAESLKSSTGSFESSEKRSSKATDVKANTSVQEVQEFYGQGICAICQFNNLTRRLAPKVSAFWHYDPATEHGPLVSETRHYTAETSLYLSRGPPLYLCSLSKNLFA